MEKKTNILITGASGFIGTHLVVHALAGNYNVYALVRKSSKITTQEHVQYIYADITNVKELKTVFEELNEKKVTFEHVIHAAALTKSHSKSEIEVVNYIGTYNLYKALEKLERKPERVVLISSLAACGPEKRDNIISAAHAKPVTTYGKSKLKAEKYALNESKIPTVVVRPTAVYGPGERDLYSVFKMIGKNFNPILGFHKQQLTFIYVTDLVDIIFAALERGQNKAVYFATDGYVYDKRALPNLIKKYMNKNPFNITFPKPVVKALAFCSQGVSRVTRKASSLNMEKYRELVAASWMCDVQYTFEQLKVQPKYDLSKGIKETTEWYKVNNWI